MGTKADNTTPRGKLAILVGGGPAPGINSVIAGATMEALQQGLEVVGVLDGFKWLSKRDTSHTMPLSADLVADIRRRGGSVLRTSRENPTTDPAKMANVVEALKDLGVGYLVTIGGDDTAFSASTTAKHAGSALTVAHVPKTIDNDLPLPGKMPTFGYNTARHVGAELVTNLAEDARTTRRWYIVVAMGRTAGHLALGMGRVGGAALTVIPEEFGDRPVDMGLVCDIVEGAVLKSRLAGRDYGVAVLAEGIGELMVDELKEHPFVEIKHDKHGHVRLAEVPLALIVKKGLQQRASARQDSTTFVDITIGYELRCANPIPFDVEYCEQLGWGAVRYVAGGDDPGVPRTGAMISIQENEVKPILFEDILDPKTKKTAVRRVDVSSDLYASARRSMLRLEAPDLADADACGRLAALAGLTEEEFRARFARAVAA